MTDTASVADPPPKVNVRVLFPAVVAVAVSFTTPSVAVADVVPEMPVGYFTVTAPE